MGVERKSLIISDQEKKVTAYHESGHVLVAKKIPEADPVHKVTIIPRGRALGVTTYLPIDEKHTYSKEYLEAMIAYALGGRAAEKLIFDQFTTGDLQAAWDSAAAAWVRAPLASDRGVALRADLDRLMLLAIIPERARATAQPPENLRAEWDKFKEKWQGN